MPKPNARTFRYSDEVKLILEQYDNDFDKLVIESHLMLPAIRKELEDSHNRNEELRQKRIQLYNDISDISKIKGSISQCEYALNELKKRIESNL